MIDPSSIKKDMPVIASDGERIGEVDGVEAGERVKLKRQGSVDGHHHYVALADVARVDEHVHLMRSAAEVRAGWLTAGAAGAETATAATTTTATEAVHGARDVHVEGSKNWLPWILGSLALLALLIFGLRSCDNKEPAALAPVGDNVAVPQEPVAPVGNIAMAAGEESVPLPGGGSVMVATGTIGYQLQRYLASNEPTPKTFQFERLNFDTAKADVRAIDRPTIDGLAQILKAYPNSRVRVVGYADARGAAGPNADLGLNRAKAVAAALGGGGVAADRIETGTGGEANATDTNTTAQGQAENRRTELVVLKK